MSPSKPVRNIKVHVPRHNSQRLGPAVTAQVQFLAKRRRIRVDIRQTAYEPSNILAQAIESASDWNSRLMTARAERGPQWDIGTQQFLVDEHSDLYYDPSPLRGYLTEGKESEENEQSSSSKPQVPASGFSVNSAPVPSTPQLNRRTSMPPPQPHMPFSPRHPHTGFAPQGMQYSNMNTPMPPPSGQFYGNNSAMSSPMRISGMGMPMEAMSGMGIGSPDIARRIGMGDGYGGIH